MFLLMQQLTQLRHRGSLYWVMFTVFQWCCGPLSSRYIINLCIKSITRKKQFGKFPQRHTVCYSWRLQTQLILSFLSFWLLPRSHLLLQKKTQINKAQLVQASATAACSCRLGKRKVLTSMTDSSTVQQDLGGDTRPKICIKCGNSGRLCSDWLSLFTKWLMSNIQSRHWIPRLMRYSSRLT